MLYKVIVPWSGVAIGQVVDIENINPFLLPNVAPADEGAEITPVEVPAEIVEEVVEVVEAAETAEEASAEIVEEVVEASVHTGKKKGK